MQVSIQEFNEIINNGADAGVKAALQRFFERATGKDHYSLDFEIDRTATEIEQAFERFMVDDFRNVNTAKTEAK